LEWGDGSKLLGSGFFIAAFLLNHTSNVFSQDNDIQVLLRQWIPYFLSFMSEKTENMNSFMCKRKEIMERLSTPFVIKDLTINFKLTHYIGDLSHLWKVFLISMSHCAHCVEEYSPKNLLKAKQSKRRSVSNLILGEIFSKYGMEHKLSLYFSNFERNSNSKTCCDILHSIKGSIEHLQTLLEEFDGIDHQLFVELQSDILQKGDVSLLSGGLTRLFLLKYEKWLPMLSDKLKEQSTSSKRRHQISQRFEHGKGNLEWILFLLSLICKMVYRSDSSKSPHEIAFMECVTTLLYMSLHSRYGDAFLNKHLHGVIVHFPQDFATVFQRMASCERGEFMISVLKRVALTESNRSQPNALTSMVLSLTANMQRLLDGEKDNFKDDNKMFSDIDVKECNFTLSGNSCT